MHVHEASKCKGEACPIHNPSDHNMLDWEMFWDSDAVVLLRICSHKERHVDPDDFRGKKFDCFCSCRCCQLPNEAKAKDLIEKYKDSV
jgi:hypothetical protein